MAAAKPRPIPDSSGDKDMARGKKIKRMAWLAWVEEYGICLTRPCPAGLVSGVLQCHGNAKDIVTTDPAADISARPDKDIAVCVHNRGGPQGYPAREHLPARVRAVIDWLAIWLGTNDPSAHAP
jgi:hypothetical protein